MGSDATIQNIADLVVAEANNMIGDDLVSNIYTVMRLVNMAVGKMGCEIRKAERGRRLRKEILGE